jgi:hypothetical protein
MLVVEYLVQEMAWKYEENPLVNPWGLHLAEMILEMAKGPMSQDSK